MFYYQEKKLKLQLSQTNFSLNIRRLRILLVILTILVNLEFGDLVTQPMHLIIQQSVTILQKRYTSPNKFLLESLVVIGAERQLRRGWGGG